MLQSFLPFEHELVVDLFAGGGGASEAMKEELGREPDIAINHDPDAVDVHTVNHPSTKHYCEDIYAVDPVSATRGRPVGLLHASPDCTDHSQAKGGQPRRKAIRGLSWVVCKWAGKTSPRCITLENVEQILKWGPLIAKRDPATGRVVKIDRTVAAPGERVPLREQFLVPDPKRVGKTWKRFVAHLKSLGYNDVDWRKLKAHEFGAGTSRERLFMVARRDGLPIVWPKPTHGKRKGMRPIVTAADCVDWSIDVPSIFDRKKPLAEATMRRIAKGIQRYVINCADPFIVPVTHSGSDRVHSIRDPLKTITAAHRGEFMLAAPTLIQNGYGERPGQSPRVPGIEKPVGTIVAEGIKHSVVTAELRRVASAHVAAFGQNCKGIIPDKEPLQTILAGATRYGIVSAFMEQANTDVIGHDAREPVSTIVQKASTQRVATASLATFRGSNVGAAADSPVRTLSAGGEHHAIVRCGLSPEAGEGALKVAAFLLRYYSNGGQWGDVRDPADTLTTRERIALVTVTIKGVPHVIVDIGLRMLTPPELFKAQGFGPNYVYNRRSDGSPVPKTIQVRMVGNSVSPPPYRALLRANFEHERQYRMAA